jgi:hypothetical protein
MSTGPEDTVKHPDSLTGTSEADASDGRDDPTSGARAKWTPTTTMPAASPPASARPTSILTTR